MQRSISKKGGEEKNCGSQLWTRYWKKKTHMNTHTRTHTHQERKRERDGSESMT